MSNRYLVMENEQWKIRVGQMIDLNSFGEVHEAYWCGPVAVKALTNNDRDADAQKRAFQNEMEILKSLRHPNVLLYYGREKKPTRAIVIELYDFSLYDYLYGSKFKYEITNRVDIGRQIARGMSYIHSHNIIHCNLKSSSIFLLNNLTVKIGDFGLALKTLSEQHSQRCGTDRWMSPEIARMDKNPYTFLSDVYAFGAVLFELMAGELPHSNFNDVEMIMRMVGRGHLSLDLTKLHSDTPQTLRELIHNCIKFYSYKRPFFSDILEKIEAPSEISQSISEPTTSNFSTVQQAVCASSEEKWRGRSFYSTLMSSTNPFQQGAASSTPIDGKQMNEVSKKKFNDRVRKNVHFAEDTAEETKHNQSEDNGYSEMKDIFEKKKATQLEMADGIEQLRDQMSDLIELQIIVGKSLQSLLEAQCNTQRKFDILNNTLTTLLLEDRQRREEPDLPGILRNKDKLYAKNYMLLKKLLRKAPNPLSIVLTDWLIYVHAVKMFEEEEAELFFYNIRNASPEFKETSEKFSEKKAPAAHSSQPVDVTEIKCHRCTKKGHYKTYRFATLATKWLGKLRNNAQIPTNCSTDEESTASGLKGSVDE